MSGMRVTVTALFIVLLAWLVAGTLKTTGGTWKHRASEAAQPASLGVQLLVLACLIPIGLAWHPLFQVMRAAVILDLVALIGWALFFTITLAWFWAGVVWGRVSGRTGEPGSST